MQNGLQIHEVIATQHTYGTWDNEVTSNMRLPTRRAQGGLFAGFVYPYLTYDPAPLSATQPGPTHIPHMLQQLPAQSETKMESPFRSPLSHPHLDGPPGLSALEGRGGACSPASTIGGAGAGSPSAQPAP